MNSMNLSRLLVALRKRFWLLAITPLLAGVTAYFITASQDPYYTANATLLVDYREPVPGEVGGYLPAGLQPNYLTTQIGIISSRNVAAKVAVELGLADLEPWKTVFVEAGSPQEGFEAWAAGSLLEGLTTTADKNSSLVDIWYQHTDPKFAAAAANAFAEVYRRTNRELIVEPSRAMGEAVEERLAQLRDKTETAERDLSSYQQETGITATEERLDYESTRLDELVRLRLNADAEARATASRLAKIDEILAMGESLDTLPDVVNNSLIQNLKVEVSKKEAALADLSAIAGANHPTRIALSAELRSLRARLDTETDKIVSSIRNEVDQANSAARAVEQAEQAQREKVLEMKKVRDGMSPLLREVEAARGSYERALAMSSEYVLNNSLNQPNVTILNPARVPELPSGPNMKLNVAAAFALGGILGLILALMLEILEGKVRSRDDIEDGRTIRVLGEIPRPGNLSAHH